MISEADGEALPTILRWLDVQQLVIQRVKNGTAFMWTH
jgi:hypothetical protein